MLRCRKRLAAAVCRLPLVALLGFAASVSAQDAQLALGRSVFGSQCAFCHTADKASGNKAGPNLFGVVGRRPASLADFAYSDALRNVKAEPWTEQSLRDFLAAPQRYAPGTYMGYSGILSDAELNATISYLRGLQ